MKKNTDKKETGKKHEYRKQYRGDKPFIQQIEERAEEDDELMDMLINKIYPMLEKELL